MNVDVSGTSAVNESSSSPPPSAVVVDGSYYSWCADYSTAIRIFCAVTMICFLLGFPVNAWVLYELLQRQRQKSTRDFIMLFLAVTNLAFMVQIPLCVCNFMLWHIEMLQMLITCIYHASVNSRPLFMACLCWDVYVAVVHPIAYRTSKRRLFIQKVIAIAICFSMIGFGLMTCTMTWLITTPFIAVPMMVALPVVTFCDVSTLLALRKPDPTGKIQIHPQKKQAHHNVLSSFIMTFVVYLPPTVIFLFMNLMPLGETERFCCVVPYGFCFSTAGCVIMPVLHLISLGKIDTLKNFCNK